jgi:hypothetical protein
VSQRAWWRRFVERRRRELRDRYPCAVSTRRRRCPKHRVLVGPFTGICKRCRDGLFEQLAAEYVNHREEMIMINKPASPAEADRPPVSVFIKSKSAHVAGQLELFDADGRAREHTDDTQAEEVIDDAA